MNSGGGTSRRFKPARAALHVATAGVLLALVGCAPAPRILSWPSPTPTDPGPPTDAAFTVSAGGLISCNFPLGCDALAWLEPVPDGASPSTLTISPRQQITFSSLPTSIPGTSEVSLMPIGAPTRLPAGRYKVAGEVNTITDTLPVVTTPMPVDRVPSCLANLTVAADTSVKVALTFAAAGGCTITTSATPEVDVPSPRPPGVVPDREMTLSVSNATTIDVVVFVNGVFVASLAAGSCAGCDGIPASVLPQLPWLVELRTPAGRALQSITIHSGDVVYDPSGEVRGPGARLDLSCGRIDVWSGPSIAGPAPGTGTPGDCRP